MLDRESLADFGPLIPSGLFDLAVRRPGDYIVLGAAAEGEPCGALVAAPELDGIGLTHLFVAPSFRGRGICSRLMDRLVAGLPEMPGAKLSCLFAQSAKERSLDPVCGCLSHKGFRIAAFGGLFKTTLGALGGLSFWQQSAGDRAGALPFSALDAEDLKDFNKRTMRSLDLRALPYREADALPDLSHAFIADGRIKGIAAVTGGADAIRFSWLYSESPYTKYLPELLRAVYGAALAGRGPDTAVQIAAINETSLKLCEKLCPPDGFYPLLKAEADIGTLRARAPAKAAIGRLAAADDGMSWWDGLWDGRRSV
jgi:GNAT superfamily N-acetyltransferase